jgi:molybdopterin-biosynthesis enzyme MoeA-like protein
MGINEIESNVTQLFRLYLSKSKTTTNNKNYEYLDGELWYCGYPLRDSRMTVDESMALEYALREAMNNLAAEATI